MPRLTETMARRAVDRAVADRHAEYAEEMQRIVDATYSLIERNGSFDPSLRDILKETGLSTQAFYRYFQSKDELMLLLLDDGRHQLLSYLEHRMARAGGTTADRVRAWIEGVLTQAASVKAADRTRPFVVSEARLAEAYPEEHRISIDLLIDQLADVLAAGTRSAKVRRDRRRDAEAIYRLAFGTLNQHLIARTRPTSADVDHLVRFALQGAAVT
jgi:AcrR family transcriptional regulator